MAGEIIRKIVDIIFIILDVIIIGYALYFFVTGLFAFKKEKKKNKINKKIKFAVLIPARNEENIIDNLILSLQAQKYPKEDYDIFVILNNCTDKTEEVVKKLGVNVINCIPGIKNKGEALKYGFSYMIQNYPEYEAYAIFDADNVVHPKFLHEMNSAMCLGYDVVQGYRDSKNPSDSWISCSYTLFYLVQNYFFNRARIRMNYSASINGTGFAVTKKIIEEHGFKTVTITEDIEYAALCSLNNVPIYFAEKAITYDEQPINFGTSWKQRKRWSIGTMSCMKNYSSKLIKKTFKENKAQSFDMALFYMAPIIQVLSFFVIIFYMFWNIFEPGIFIGKVLAIVASYITCVVFSVVTLLLTKRKIKKYIKGIFALPFFILTWIPINIVCLFVKEIKWEQIKHQRKVEVESIVKFD